MPCDRSNSSSEGDPPSRPPPSLVHAILNTPRAIFEYGAEKGREWRAAKDARDLSRFDRPQPAETIHQREGSSASPGDPSLPPTGAPWSSSGGSGDNDRDDFSAWIKKALEEGNSMADDWYKSAVQHGGRVAEDWHKMRAKARERDGGSRESVPEEDDFTFLKKRIEDVQQWSGVLEGAIDSIFPGVILNDEVIFGQRISQLPETTPIPLRSDDLSAIDDKCKKIYTDFYNHFFETPDRRFLQPFIWSAEYSPLNLEHQEGFDETWRARFEDLMRAETGRPFLTASEMDQLVRLPPRDYPVKVMQSMVSIQPIQPQTETDPFRRHPLTVPGRQSEENEGYLSKQIAYHKQQRKEWSWNYDSAASKDGVKSVYRTREEKLQDDGRVVAKTIVRTTFADGREQTTESTEVVPSAGSPIADPKTLEHGPSREADPNKEMPHQSSGWFWKK